MLYAPLIETFVCACYDQRGHIYTQTRAQYAPKPMHVSVSITADKGIFRAFRWCVGCAVLCATTARSHNTPQPWLCNGAKKKNRELVQSLNRDATVK